MTDPAPTFVQRLALAWRTLIDAAFAARVAHHLDAPPVAPSAPAASAAPLREISPDAALQLLGLLQQEGRLLDFLQEDVGAYTDADIGAAARVVHEGCGKVLREYLEIEPISDREEGVQMTLDAGFDAAAIRLTGNVVGRPPFTGTLVHRGWRATGVKLPKLANGHDARVLAPAEVEL